MVWSATNSGFTAASHAHKADFFPSPPEPFLLKKGLALQGRAKERLICASTFRNHKLVQAHSIRHAPDPLPSCLLQASQACKSWTKRTSYPAPPTGSGNDFNDDCPPLHMGQEAQPSHGPDNLTGLKNVQEARSRKLAQA